MHVVGDTMSTRPLRKVFDWFSGSGIARISDQELSKLDITFATRWGSGCFHMLEICALFYYKIFIWGIFHKQLNTWCELVLAAGRRTQISLDATWTHSRVYVARGLMQWRLSLCRLKMRQRRGKTNSFERSRRCAAQKSYCCPSCRLHDGKGSDIPLTFLLSARQRKGRRDPIARWHSTMRGWKWQGKIERLMFLNMVSPLMSALLLSRSCFLFDDAHKKH